MAYKRKNKFKDDKDDSEDVWDNEYDKNKKRKRNHFSKEGCKPKPKCKNDENKSYGKILSILLDLIHCDPIKKMKHFNYKIGKTEKKQGDMGMSLELTITNEQKITVTLVPVAKDKPAKLDGAPVWSVVSGDSTFVAAEDGLSASLVSSDAIGDTTFQIKADAKIGEGITELIDTVNLHVVAVAEEEADNLGLTAGAPEPK